MAMSTPLPSPLVAAILPFMSSILLMPESFRTKYGRRVVAGRAVLDLVGDDAKVGQAAVLDRQREARVAERAMSISPWLIAVICKFEEAKCTGSNV